MTKGDPDERCWNNPDDISQMRKNPSPKPKRLSISPTRSNQKSIGYTQSIEDKENTISRTYQIEIAITTQNSQPLSFNFTYPSSNQPKNNRASRTCHTSHHASSLPSSGNKSWPIHAHHSIAFL